MSYCIDEAIDNAEKAALTFKKIQERFPDARSDGKYWVTEMLALKDCNYIDIINDQVIIGTKIDEKVIIRERRTNISPGLLFTAIGRYDPELYIRFLEFCQTKGWW